MVFETTVYITDWSYFLHKYVQKASIVCSILYVNLSPRSEK
jgi:hypothetical protein